MLPYRMFHLMYHFALGYSTVPAAVGISSCHGRQCCAVRVAHLSNPSCAVTAPQGLIHCTCCLYWCWCFFLAQYDGAGVLKPDAQQALSQRLAQLDK